MPATEQPSDHVEKAADSGSDRRTRRPEQAADLCAGRRPAQHAAERDPLLLPGSEDAGRSRRNIQVLPNLAKRAASHRSERAARRPDPADERPERFEHFRQCGGTALTAISPKSSGLSVGNKYAAIHPPDDLAR
jgi:hypothetical protein